jgi:hypothetical protein
MEKSNSESFSQQLQRRLSGTPDVPAHQGLIGFSRRIFPMLGINSFPNDTASSTTPDILGSGTMMENRPDETTLSGRSKLRAEYEGQRQQQNLEDISFNAGPYIKEDAKPDEVKEDWLSIFSDRSRLVSDKEVQKLWSHILAGEFNKPGSFSPLTLNTLFILTKNDALLFRKFCSFVWIDDEDKALAIMPYSLIGKDKLSTLALEDIFHLQDVGLLSYESVVQTHWLDDTKLIYQGHLHTVRKKGDIENKIVTGFHMGAVSLTLVGRELFTICTPEPHWDYLKEVLDMWNKEGFEVKELV